MKKTLFKIIIVICVGILVMAIMPKTTKGDVNNDGIVDHVDLGMVQKHLLGVEKLDERQLKRADTNKDGKIDIVDLANIQKIILEVK